MLLSVVTSSQLLSKPATGTSMLEMMESGFHEPNPTDSQGVDLEANESLPQDPLQLTNLTLSVLSCILLVLGIALIIHLIRMEKKRIKETRAAVSALREVLPTSRTDLNVEAHPQPVRFNCDRRSENYYVEIDEAFCEAQNKSTYDETEVCKELDAYYDSLFGRDSVIFQKNLNTTHPDLTQGKAEAVSSFIKSCTLTSTIS
ncbi:uncharacterized protein [Palaemon carinicauda]|uniref:uncharacterized protein n=1 Tax=Palaemon carinicauda TaxID=392227 RepID=UPI0035B66443